jgi:type II secretory pathway pseudopilin PulG
MTTTGIQTQSGFTLVELVVTGALLGGLVYAVSTLSVSGAQAQDYARRLNRATEITHELIDQIRTEALSCSRIFGDDTEGQENLAMLDLAGAPPPIASSRLPVIDAGGVIQPDTAGAEVTGNTLFFTRLAWTTQFEVTSGNDYLIDVYRWVYYYLTPEDGGPRVGSPLGLNLVRIESEPLVDAASIDRITVPAEKAEVLLHLFDGTPDAAGVRHAPCEVVWRRGALPSVAGTLRQILDDGSLRDNPTGSRPSTWNVYRTTPTVRGLLSYRHHSVATNFSRPNFGVGRYSVTNLATGFPHGFEVQVVGPATARQILVHLVIASNQQSGQWAWSDVQVVIDTKDL